MTAITIHSKRIGLRFSWEVPRHGSRVGALDRLQASIPSEYFPAFTTALQRHRARFIRAAAANFLLHTVSPLLGVERMAPVQLLSVLLYRRPRRDISWYRSTLSAADRQEAPGRRRPRPAGVGRVADPAGTRRARRSASRLRRMPAPGRRNATRPFCFLDWHRAARPPRRFGSRSRVLSRGQAAARGSPAGRGGAGRTCSYRPGWAAPGGRRRRGAALFRQAVKIGDQFRDRTSWRWLGSVA
jgi:hypothetical protein